jgi:hypothetical protein
MLIVDTQYCGSCVFQTYNNSAVAILRIPLKTLKMWIEIFIIKFYEN